MVESGAKTKIHFYHYWDVRVFPYFLILSFHSTPVINCLEEPRRRERGQLPHAGQLRGLPGHNRVRRRPGVGQGRPSVGGRPPVFEDAWAPARIWCRKQFCVCLNRTNRTGVGIPLQDAMSTPVFCLMCSKTALHNLKPR